MSGDRDRNNDLGINVLLWMFAVLAVALLALLASVPVRWYHSEWRGVQQRYNRLARASGAAPVEVSIKQIWKPKLGVVDRCTSCHLADGHAAPLAKHPLFAAHPKMPHAPGQFGCTICHGGQGRATTKVAAHGNVEFWAHPILPLKYVQAGCGTCHLFKVPPEGEAAKGRKLVKSAKCLKCHQLSGEGGSMGPDLSWEGLKGIPHGWHGRHVIKAMSASKGPWVGAFSPLAGEEVKDVDAYLQTQVGAPRLFAGKALAYRLGCRGCHRIDGVGGDDGPDLSAEGSKDPHSLVYSGVTGPHTLPNWLKQHFLDPAKVVKGSKMPNLGLTDKQADLLVTFVLSLKKRDLPESVIPPDRARALRLRERDFATSGKSIYGVFCAACHGPRGVGRRYKNRPTIFPAIGNLEFLALATNKFIEQTITRGRPGRPMPSWGAGKGGLGPDEIKAVTHYLRSLEPKPPTFAQVEAEPADVDTGRKLFLANCKGCHGPGGGGSVIAPPIAAPDDPVTGDDSRIYGTLTQGVAGTAMGSFRRFNAAELRALIAFVRALPKVSAHRTGWKPQKGNAARGAKVYAANCVKCHGPHGTGAEAPALANPAFLAVANDGYLTATIIRGRGTTEMPHFGTPGDKHSLLSPQQVADVVAYLRSLAPKPKAHKGKKGGKGGKGAATRAPSAQSAGGQ